MRILVVGSHIMKDTDKQSQVDIWRLGSPMQELAKHVDWTIDHQPTYIVGFDKYTDKTEFTEEEMGKAFDHLTSYDIVFSSYHPDPTAYAMLKVARDRANTQFVMDCDDNMFAINEDNPVWMKINDQHVYQMQRMIADNDWITTTNEALAQEFRDRRPDKPADSVVVLPNYISDAYQHPTFNNDPSIVIGYCGGASHYADLHDSGVLDAIQKLMHENKQVRFKCAGMVVDTYIPKGRFEFEPGKKGMAYHNQVFPKLKFDIAVAPILANKFNEGKSNIKWQEMTRAGAAVVASNVGPYKTLTHGHNALLVDNAMYDWYSALKSLVDDIVLRKQLVRTAQADLRKDYRIEDHWQIYKQLFERVAHESASYRRKWAARTAVAETPPILLSE